MRILSWNINGLPSCLKSGAFEPLRTYQADAICLQEIRTRAEPVILEGYRHYCHHSIRDKYSGTAMLLREEPLRVHYGLTDDFDDSEGRAITAELRDFFLVNVYVPNSQQTFYRHAYRREWDAVLRAYVRDLLYDKPVVICGDFNVARESIDIYPENMRLYWAEQGYASDERSDLETLLEEGLTDAYRALHPGVRSYTWWSNRLYKRKEGRGWRLDYFLVSDEMMDSVRDVVHLQDVYGSDHCPILLEVAP